MNPSRVTPRGVVAALALLLLAAVPARANNNTNSEESKDGSSGRPQFRFLRQDEDWSKFVAGSDPFDPLKRISLNDDGSVWLSIGGRAEGRVESWKNFAFGAPDDDDTFILSRVLLHGDLHLGEHFRLFAEGKTAQSTERDLPGGRRTLDMDTLALQQLFAETPLEFSEENELVLRGGRQMISLGRQRLISPLPWGNTLRTWDGLRGDLTTGDWVTTALAASFVPVDKTEPNTPDRDQLLFGLYAHRDGDAPGRGTELYWLANTRGDITVNGSTGDARRHTLGTRLWHRMDSGMDVEFEGAGQVGTVGDADVLAGFATLELGYRPESSWDHRWFLGLDWASGDNRAGGDVQTFDQLYPLGHAYLGYMDYIGRQNIVGANAGISWWPVPRCELRAAVHSFWLESLDDALYNAGGGVLRAPGNFSTHHVGYEFDLLARRPLGRHWNGYAGYSHFFSGGALEDSGPSRDADFFYLGLGFTF